MKGKHRLIEVDQEIPLLRESAAFSSRLIAAAQMFGDSRYFCHRRVNWSYRYSETFYAAESQIFRENPAAYIDNRVRRETFLEDVYANSLPRRLVIKTVAKVFTHLIYRAVGVISFRFSRHSELNVYRKAYVDDIELVFDPEEPSVLRGVYPFPISPLRQIKYLGFLIKQRYDFKVTGYPYIWRDFVHFIIRRDVRSMMRLESRAQIRHAKELVSKGIIAVQLSDEFDLGSLDFTRTMNRLSVEIVNSAHGIGKYLPVHAYKIFKVLTQRQVEYYHAINHCRYQKFQLNQSDVPAITDADARGCNLIFLSQSLGPAGNAVINTNEVAVISRLQAEFSKISDVHLYYKPHPNYLNKIIPKNFKAWPTTEGAHISHRSIYVSFFSTCQIDPSFEGRKILIRGDLIFPEISFDETEEIVDLDTLVTIVHHAAHQHPNHIDAQLLCPQL